MARRRTDNGVNGLRDAGQGRIRTDGRIGAVHIVVDRAYQSGKKDSAVLFCQFGVDLTGFDQAGEVLRPFLAQQVGAGKTAVAADHDQGVDTQADEVEHRFPAAFRRAKLIGPRRPDLRTAFVQNAPDRRPPGLFDVVAPQDHSLVSFIYGIDVESLTDASPDHGPDGGIHALGVAAAGEYRY